MKDEKERWDLTSVLVQPCKRCHVPGINSPVSQHSLLFSLWAELWPERHHITQWLWDNKNDSELQLSPALVQSKCQTAKGHGFSAEKAPTVKTSFGGSGDGMVEAYGVLARKMAAVAVGLGWGDSQAWRKHQYSYSKQGGGGSSPDLGSSTRGSPDPCSSRNLASCNYHSVICFHIHFPDNSLVYKQQEQKFLRKQNFKEAVEKGVARARGGGQGGSYPT